MQTLSEGLVVVVKRDCPTCTLIAPVLARIVGEGGPCTVYCQDDPSFPAGLEGVVDDTALEHSYKLGIDTVPTLIRFEGGREARRTVGWDRAEWATITAIEAIGDGLPEFQPGCASRSVEPGMAEVLEVRFGTPALAARQVSVTDPEDPIEACFDRGWSDGLPVVPPTRERVLRMLKGTTRAPNVPVGLIPPNYGPCTVEKVAINAVMAGCAPEYLVVVLAAVEAVLAPEFAMHGLLCTTYFTGPVVIVNGPIARRIGMNSGVNALGQGSRANSTIGRALQLVVRNVGGGVPGGIDRATLGQPGKVSFCFAEDELDPDWPSLATERGVAPGASAVTLFAGDGPLGCFDEGSRTPESLSHSLASSLQVIGHPKKVQGHDALLVLSPEHHAIYREAGWDKARIKAAIEAATVRDARELERGAGGNDAGMAPGFASGGVAKFRPGGFHIVRAGGPAGLMSAIIGGWAATGERGSEPVTREIGT